MCLLKFRETMCATTDMSVQYVGVAQLSMEEELDNDMKDECVCTVRCRGADDTTACRMGTDQPDECVCTVQCTGHISTKGGGFVTGGTGGRGDDGQNISLEMRKEIGQSESMKNPKISIQSIMCREENKNENECGNLPSNIFTDKQVQLSCATLTRYAGNSATLVLEKDLTMNYKVGEEIEGGVTLPDFNIWMSEMRACKHQRMDKTIL